MCPIYIYIFFLQEIQQSVSIFLNKTCYNSFALLESKNEFLPFRLQTDNIFNKCEMPCTFRYYGEINTGGL